MAEKKIRKRTRATNGISPELRELLGAMAFVFGVLAIAMLLVWVTRGER